MRHVLGVSAFYHDSAAALVVDGEIVAAAQEERFSRRKNDEKFPTAAANYCLAHAKLTWADLDAVAFYDKPITKFGRILETYLAIAPRGLLTFPRVLPMWLGEKLDLRKTIRDELPGLPKSCEILFTQHHHAHAASAFFPSPFASAAVLTVDGVGEWATTTIGHGQGNRLTIEQELRFPHSLGLLYSAFTAYCGFRINSGEYKLMGLAPYGEPRYANAIRRELVDLRPDGSFRLNLDYFAFLNRLVMTNEKFDALFGGPARAPDEPIVQRHMDVARSIQLVTEEIMLALARHARDSIGEKNLCLAGGVALNCVANGLISRARIFDRIWIQPAAGDAGGAIGAALAAWYDDERQPSPERVPAPRDAMKGALLGPEYGDDEIRRTLNAYDAQFEELSTEALLERVVDLLVDEKVVGWFQGRMEFGPRALGNRSILGDARSPRIQSTMNLRVKFRESFRPFAPAVLEDRASDYFEIESDSPYMLFVAPVRESLRRCPDASARGLDRVKQVRSTIPAVTHIDYTARVQTVGEDANPLFYSLLRAFESRTGCGVLVNTSFNVRGEPIVCSPDDAFRCFMNTEIDYLVLGHCLLERVRQPDRAVARPVELVAD